MAPKMSQQDFMHRIIQMQRQIEMLQTNVVSTTAHTCQLRRIALGSIATGSLTGVAWDTNDYTSANFTVSLSTGVTVGADGAYRISASAEWANNATGRRFIAVLRNGSEITGFTRATVAVNAAAFTTDCILQPRLYALSAGDVINIGGFQDSGVSLNISQVILTIDYTPN